MTVYAVGDVQGCYDPLMRLLEAADFQDDDELWMVGDLVNRGPQSSAVLRLAKNFGERCKVVLGNHDISLLLYNEGLIPAKGKDTFDEVTAQADGEELIDWLRHRPLLHHDAQRGIIMVHAGVFPAWSLQESVQLAREVEEIFQGEHYRACFQRLFNNKPRHWRSDLSGMERIRFAVNVFTRMRYLDAKQALEFECKLPPAQAPEHLRPWYLFPRKMEEKILFGHWASLGYRLLDRAACLDSGCFWGQSLTLFDVDKWEKKQAVACQACSKN